MPGPPPKPTKIRLLEGNRGRLPINPSEPQPKATHIFCPAWVDGYGRRVWKRLQPQLLALGLLTDFDIDHLGAYCQAVSDVMRCRKVLKEKGEHYEVGGYLVPRPEVKNLENAYARVRAFGTQFGFTPASRSKVTANPSKEQTLNDLLG